ncbi:MAG: hypothetical protein JNK05_17860 [Myxococcales bacterium]|nr:hypothetical protein [Myxococcales bacterium]
MTHRRKIILGSLLGAVAIHVVFLACGMPSTAHDASMHDGATLADVAGDIADRETSTADAQGMPSTMLEAQCAPPAAGTTPVAYFDVPSVRASAVPRLRASLCGFAGGVTYLPGAAVADACLMAPGVFFTNGRVAVTCNGATTVRLVVE